MIALPSLAVGALALVATIFSQVLADQTPIQPDKNKTNIDIPPIGLGLWNSKDENVRLPFPSRSRVRAMKERKLTPQCLTQATHAVEYAFKAGYRHLDSAAAYSAYNPLRSCSRCP